MLVLEPSAGRGALARKARDAGATVMCVDIDQKNVDTLVADGFSALCQDFLTMTPKHFECEVFDCVVMNPPFANRADIRHVMHAARFVKPGGRLVAIMSAGVDFRTDLLARQFHEFLRDNNGGLLHVDEGAFREAGTMVRTVIASMKVR